MRYRSPARTGAFCAALAAAAACADLPSGGALPPDSPRPPAERLACTAHVRAGTVSCTAPEAAGGPRADRILGQGPSIRVLTNLVGVVADTFAFDLTVANLLPYPIGTSDGQTANPRGVRVFVADGIHVVEGTGTVTVANADGEDAFTAPNQPYFAYVGIVSPNSFFPSRRWKMRFSIMVESFTFGLYVSVPTQALRGGLRPEMILPDTTAVGVDTVRVRVRIPPVAAPVAAVQLAVRGHLKPSPPGVGPIGWRSTFLKQVGANDFEGLVDLGGFQAGAVELTASAATSAGDTGSVILAIDKDVPLRLAWTGQAEGAQVLLATPRLGIGCEDDAPFGCDSVVVKARTPRGEARLPLQPSGAHHWWIPLDLVDEQEVTLTATGWSGARTTTLTRTGYVELAPGLSLYMWCDGLALAVSDNQILCRSYDGGLAVKVQEYALPISWRAPPGSAGAYAYLRTGGVVYPSTGGRVVDSGCGDLGPISADSSLRTTGAVSRHSGSEWFADQWAIWSDGSTLYRAETETCGAPAVISTVAGGYYNRVLSNGDMVYWTTSHQVYRYSHPLLTYPNDLQPTWTQLTHDSEADHWNVYPVSDGTSVVYLKTDQHGSTVLQPGRVTVWKDGVETVLPGLLPDARPARQYAVTYGYVAHAVIDGGVSQIHVLSPDGTDRQATFGSTDSEIRWLAWDGMLTFARDGSVYRIRSPYTGPPTRLWRDWFQDHGSLLLLGNTAVYAPL